MSGRLRGKIAIVTGAASGFGAEFTRRFAAEGAKVVGVDIDEAVIANTISRNLTSAARPPHEPIRISVLAP